MTACVPSRRAGWEEGRRWLEGLLHQTSTHSAARAKALNAAAWIALQQGDGAAANSLSAQALSVARESGTDRDAALALNTLAVVAGQHSDFAAARTLLEESLAIRRQLGNKALIAGTLNNLGILSVQQGELTIGRPLLEESLALFQEVGDKHGVAMNYPFLAQRRKPKNTTNSSTPHARRKAVRSR